MDIVVAFRSLDGYHQFVSVMYMAIERKKADLPLTFILVGHKHQILITQSERL